MTCGIGHALCVAPAVGVVNADLTLHACACACSAVPSTLALQSTQASTAELRKHTSLHTYIANHLR